MPDLEKDEISNPDPLHSFNALKFNCQKLLSMPNVSATDKQQIEAKLALLADTWAEIRLVFENIGFNNEKIGDMLAEASGSVELTKQALSEAILEEYQLQGSYESQAKSLEYDFNLHFADLADFIERLGPNRQAQRKRPRLIFFVDESEDYFKEFAQLKSDGGVTGLIPDEPKSVVPYSRPHG